MSTEINVATGGGDSSVPSLSPERGSLAVLEHLRYDEVSGYHTRLGRMCAGRDEKALRRRMLKAVEWDRVAGANAVLFIGSALGGGLGLIPLLSIENEMGDRAASTRTIVEYCVALGVAFFIGLLSLFFRMAIKSQRADSIYDVYTDIGGALARYDKALQALREPPSPTKETTE